ncbi:nuclear transport factor 2 family protein [Chitinophaga rhizosphaerae]|uniref:nuclear transport factor 2 family protein n=1 Tax=Chitinophaga rhizosphaerae TaxID=1864947 RepID=UPI000F80ADAE|nr:nuclear transport factor 2 family protein [Chitinophaga rhizosphaerae]
MTTAQIASRLETLCRAGDFHTAVDELYADAAVSIEPYETPDFQKETRGKTNILRKGEKFGSMVDNMHALTVRDTVTTGNVIAMVMGMDVTMKGRPRANFEELCVYHVKDGKIVSEQFFM